MSRIRSPKLRKGLAALVSIAPTRGLRSALYTAVFGYSIGKGARIALGAIIAVDAFTCGEGVTIGRGTTFMGPIDVRLGDRVTIGKRNQFTCGDAVADPSHGHMNYARRIVCGDDSLINEAHIFDVLGEIRIGKGTWVAGFGSQFLTHGAGVLDRDIAIGERCFIGSAVRFTPSSGLGDDVVLGMSATVTKVIPDNNVVVGGFPARVLRDRGQEDKFSFEKIW